MSEIHFGYEDVSEPDVCKSGKPSVSYVIDDKPYSFPHPRMMRYLLTSGRSIAQKDTEPRYPVSPETKRVIQATVRRLYGAHPPSVLKRKHAHWQIGLRGYRVPRLTSMFSSM